MVKLQLAIFASGSGSNAVNIINHFNNDNRVDVSFIYTNKSDAPIIEKARSMSVDVIVGDNAKSNDGDYLLDICKKVDFIILAGFLRKIPEKVISAFSDRIINVHPSLLPKYGGKGMYGANVHKAVIEAKENLSGITIHYVNEEFDKGRIIAQFSTALSQEDDATDVQRKVQVLEQDYFPVVIEKELLRK